MGNKIAAYLEYIEQKYEGFIVSKIEVESNNIKEFSNCSIEKNDGIIVALGKKAFEEVYGVIKEIYSEEQLFLPIFYNQESEKRNDKSIYIKK